MAKVTRIKASDPGKAADKPPKTEEKTVKTKIKATKSNGAKVVKAKTSEVKTTKPKTKEPKATKPQADGKKPFILIRPFVYFGRYIKESWQEIRQVRWPSRKVTWKLFLAILVYTLLFAVVIMLLDLLFTWLFNTVIS